MPETINENKRSKRHDHSFLNLTVTAFAKPTVQLIKRHIERLDASFLRLSNDFLWMNDDKRIQEMMDKRAKIINTFESEADAVLTTYSDLLKKHHIPAIAFDALEPEETFDLHLHAAASAETIRIFLKLDRIFISLEALKQNGLIDDLAFVHTCNAWKNSASHFAKSVHDLRAQCLEQSQSRKELTKSE